MRIIDWCSDVCPSNLREDEEGEHHDDPGDQQDHDLEEIGEEADGTDEVGRRIEQRLRRIEARLGDYARPHEVADRECTTAGLQAEPGETLQHDRGKALEVDRKSTRLNSSH